MKTTEQLEKRKQKSVANRYRKDGYRVIIEPLEMPAFLQNTQVDMVALSDTDNVLIEVVSQETIKNSKKIENLALLAQKQDGWRFELIVTNHKEEKLRDISMQEINSRLEQASNILENNNAEAALLFAWSAAEATMRVIATEDGLKPKTRSPIQLTKTLYSYGSIGPSAYETLLASAEMRNRIAHGYKQETVTRTVYKITSNLIEECYHLIRRINEDGDVSDETLTKEDLIEWFFLRYKDPADGVPHDSSEGGYQYVNGGPYDPWEVLADAFHSENEGVIEDAVKEIYIDGHEWVKRDQY